MIQVGTQVWWWNRCWALWELFVVVDLQGDSPLLVLSNPGRRQLARKDSIPSSTYELATPDQFEYALTFDCTGRNRQEQRQCL